MRRIGLLLTLLGKATNAHAHAASTHTTATTHRYPTPPRIKTTNNYRDAAQLSEDLLAAAPHATADGGHKKTVAVVGGGLSGLACAKYLADAGHTPVVYEARNVLGGKVSAWQDADGDWVETGLHIFFGAYPNMMNLFEELGIEQRLQWKKHTMTFAMRDLPGTFTSFDFPSRADGFPFDVPAPFNMAAAILANNEMLSLSDKVRMLPGLLPMLLEGQDFIDAQDELSVLEFMERYGMPRQINDELFLAMGKALDFIDPDKLSMTVVLTAMNRFINEADGSQTAFLDGNQPDRLCAPMVEHIRARGGDVRCGAPLREIVVDDDTGSVRHLVLTGGEEVRADYYVSAMPVDVLKRLLPPRWAAEPFFGQLAELEGIPVITVQLWFDAKLDSVDGLCFSRSPLLSVYADMSTTCAEYADDERSVLELVFAPCSPAAGSEVNWIAKSDDEIVDATLGELVRLFPSDIARDERWASIASRGRDQGGARVRKSAVVRVPRSVYAATPGRNRFRPSQRTPIDNFVLAGCYTSQKFLGSMEGAVLAGKLAAKVIADQASGAATLQPVKLVDDSIQRGDARPPTGVHGDYPIAFGGGQQGVGPSCSHP